MHQRGLWASRRDRRVARLDWRPGLGSGWPVLEHAAAVSTPCQDRKAIEDEHDADYNSRWRVPRRAFGSRARIRGPFASRSRCPAGTTARLNAALVVKSSSCTSEPVAFRPSIMRSGKRRRGTRRQGNAWKKRARSGPSSASNQPPSAALDGPTDLGRAAVDNRRTTSR
jgi:hypothetical protein